jgi:site-specific DNA recombinase
MRAAVYARVSTERQGRQQTIDSQLAALRNWAASSGHELSEEHIYTDEGYTGSRLDRPGLDGLRDAALRGDFEIVAVLSPDRLARKYAYQVLLLEELRKAGCEVVFLHRAITDDPQDQLLLQIQGAVAEYERAVLGERFRRGKLLKARQGVWLGGKAPYGYRYVPKRDGAPGHLVVDEDEAAVVRLLFTWLVDERMTTRQVVKRLNAGPWSPRSGKRPWSPSVVHRILSDETYAGTAYANRYRFVPPRNPRSRAPGCGENTCRQPRPREEWIGIPVPALVGHATYQLAQDQLRRNAHLSYRNNTKHSYLLRCLLTCRTCGLRMFGITQRVGGDRPPRRYYRCGGKDCTSSAREARCPQRMAEAEALEAAVWGHVKALLSDPEALLAQFRDMARADAEGDSCQRAEVQKLEAQFKRLEREEVRLIDAYQAGVISLKELGSRRRGVVERRTALTDQRDRQVKLSQEAANARAVLADLSAFCERVRSRLDGATLAERQEILQLLIERVIVGEGSLEIRHVIPLRGGPPIGSVPRPPDEGLRPDGMHPAPLLLRRAPHLAHRLPEPQRPVPDRQGGFDLQPTGLAVQQELPPRLLALPVAVGHGDQLLLAVGGRPHQHQDALPAALQADVEVDAVGPDVDVMLARQRPLAPGLMVLLPGGLQPGDGRRRQVGGVGAEDRPEGLGEVAGADALQVEPGDQLLQAPGASQVGRQDGGRELLPPARRSTVVDPRLADLDLSQAGLDGPLGEVAVADDLLATGVVLEVGTCVDVGGDLGLDGLGQHPSGPIPEQVGQHVLARQQGHGRDVDGRLAHGGVLLGLVGPLVCS